MDLAALSIFRAVVRENGVTRAAAKLNRVQSNVTTRIKQLEEQLGVELFIRDGRRLVLTPAGTTLLPYAERLLALADEARHALKAGQPAGRLRLGTMESVAATRLPTVLARYHQQWPDVTLELETGTSGRLIDRVREFEVDAALVATPLDGPPAGPLFEFAPIYREELVMLTPRGHKPIRRPQDVALSTLVAFERGCSYRSHIEKWYLRHGIRPLRVLELGSYHAIIACVAAGAGVAVAPRSVLALQRNFDEVAVHSLGDFGIIDTLLVWRRGHFSPALDALRGALIEHGGQDVVPAARETEPATGIAPHDGAENAGLQTA
ncbi:LysR family transcriptional regulator [Paraburkholderia caballeronis]|uniref:DNA-binding transcriptional regulator, LysR family n=1 Tax=Paraburkholderia caballeronis TaxID=416943 RepID=A0A1H7V3H4_9BURK|nr:LysR family transcriptional regulator [Paraburkholderia caballeronis]PXW16852.1 LysR family transcriptional regulator [Paraburkholderia caballeronis]PXW94488.1 LysR family transcriptional regulator [Paraburkholderia caballeronis]RAJ89831.1 LysR family transcriptional regulator [Paraburkholderia caballeronis]TDV25346.1 LysR family transcriptional regulator [Paraburkholderia caballeronis]SEC65611.1 transcriptional regulator, LysR family [Paraburkholderia caballeronis]